VVVVTKRYPNEPSLGWQKSMLGPIDYNRGGMILRLRVVLVLVAMIACAGASAVARQSSDGGSPSNAVSLPLVSFTFDFPQSTPNHYSIAVDASGKGAYTSGEQPKSADDSDQSFRFDFKVSDATRSQILQLAQRANYFQGELERGKGKIANTGMKTLSYKDGQKNTSATFNYTTNSAAQELTRIFQSISTTMEFAERLEHFHRYQKLALDEELKRMEEMQKGNSLMEVQAIAPVLKQIVADQSVVNHTRARAERILAASNALQR
jgi:hypothetical protein